MDASNATASIALNDSVDISSMTALTGSVEPVRPPDGPNDIFKPDATSVASATSLATPFDDHHSSISSAEPSSVSQERSLEATETGKHSTTSSEHLSPATVTATASSSVNVSSTSTASAAVNDDDEPSATTAIESNTLPQPAATPADTDNVVETTSQESADIPPELLTFQEWRDRYVVVANNHAQVPPKRHDGNVASKDGNLNGHTKLGDVDSVNASSSDAANPARNDSPPSSSSSNDFNVDAVDVVESIPPTPIPPQGRGQGTEESPFQPLPNVGTGDQQDPLLLLRDRSNYALADCSAKLLRSSKQSKGASSILVEKKDRYMLTPCNVPNKFVELELCDEIQIDTIVLANFELFSSMFKHFEVSCSVDYPGKPDSWHNLGRYRARNARGLQVFPTLPVPAFCRFVRINFLSHYGSEYFCPVSLLRVYGYTQLDAYRESQRREAEEARLRALLEPTQAEDVIQDDVEIVVPTIISTESSQIQTVERANRDSTIETETSHASSGFDVDSHTGKSMTAHLEHPGESSQPADPPSQTASSVESAATSSMPSPDNPINATATQSGASTISSEPPTVANSIETSGSSSSATAVTPSSLSNDHVESSAISESASSQAQPSVTDSATSTVVSSASKVLLNVTSPASGPSSSAATTPVSPSPATTAPTVTVPTRSIRNDSTTASQRPLPPLPPRTDPQPGESIFATIMKRLSSLEHNQTLSLHYTEVQSGLLRDVLTRLDRRLLDLETTRQRQEQNFKQALIDAERIRIELERERITLTAQVTRLAREVRLEKHLSVAELIALLALFIFVGLTRGSPMSPFGHFAAIPPLQIGSVGASLGPRVDSKRPASLSEERSGSGTVPQPSRHSNQSGLTRSGSGRRRDSNALSSANVVSRGSGYRRHYGVGPSSTKAYQIRINGGINNGTLHRTWTPPARHSSAPPEDLFALNLAHALDTTSSTRSTMRRPSKKHATMPPTGFNDLDARGDEIATPGTTVSTSEAGLDIPGTTIVSARRPGSSLSNYRAQYRPSLMSRKSTNADDADTEPSEAEERLWTSDVPSESVSRERRSSISDVEASRTINQKRFKTREMNSSDSDDKDRWSTRNSSPSIPFSNVNYSSRTKRPKSSDRDHFSSTEFRSNDSAPFAVDPKSPRETPEPDIVKSDPKQS
ncbi:hypothetical protein OIO90_001485 [Microbotryomycetes sp. JL221]|nr:hypothetical protein OIO90_001485 [Microbotryomycetes sp. JL221]